MDILIRHNTEIYAPLLQLSLYTALPKLFMTV